MGKGEPSGAPAPLPKISGLEWEVRSGAVARRYPAAAGRRWYLAIHGGFLEVLGAKVRVLANAAERAEEIEVQRTRDDMKKAEERGRCPDSASRGRESAGGGDKKYESVAGARPRFRSTAAPSNSRGQERRMSRFLRISRLPKRVSKNARARSGAAVGTGG